MQSLFFFAALSGLLVSNAVRLPPAHNHTIFSPKLGMTSRVAVVDARSKDTDSSASLSASRADAIQSMEVFSEQTLGAMVNSLLEGGGLKPRDLVAAGISKMSTGEAVKKLEGKLPPDVTALVHRAADGSGADFDEASLAKARGILNGMVESAQEELDAKLIECKEFQARNRGKLDQVVSDISRLKSQVTDLSRVQSEANNGLSSVEVGIEDSRALLDSETTEYEKMKLQDQAELTIRQNDLDVITFVLEYTKCGASFLEVDGFLHGASEVPAISLCSADQGEELRFGDPKLQAEFMKKLTPNAQVMLKKALGKVRRKQQHRHKQGLLEKIGGSASSKVFAADLDEDDDEIEDNLTQALKLSLSVQAVRQPAAAGVVNASLAAAAAAPEPEPVQKRPVVAEKCSPAAVDCGLLHDGLSLVWGKFKDLVDELRMEIDEKDAEFEEMKKHMNSEIQGQVGSKNKFNMLLSEAVGNSNADLAEAGSKHEERRVLEEEYSKTMASCKAKIEEILFTDLCAIPKVRNAVLEHSAVSPPDRIVDCVVSDFVPGPCSVSCDDTCPREDPYECGGSQALTRVVVEDANEFGVRCPALSLQQKCNQIKCPVSCEMSEYSGFSKCSKECEGGVQVRTRSIITKPAHGGAACEPVQDSRPCNTGSCERDCTLADWAPWEPCSMACSGGLQTRIRKVLVPIRGDGKCPSRDSAQRHAEQACNLQDCVGDEVCIAKQDLVIALDSSGSLREDGADLLRDFAASFIGRLNATDSAGGDAVSVGVVQFGNGEIMEDGTVGPAINVHPLSSDLGDVRAAVEGLSWQRGFTNMAQAFTLAERQFQQNGRADAQSSLLLITDSKPTMHFSTKTKLDSLKDAGTKIFVMSASEKGGKEMDTMKSWVSQPWETHIVHAPGLAALQADPETFVQRSIATFCPLAVSPSASQA